ncbi:MAG TPA: hypothetical protein VFI65_13455, partial [Streptosporangiaceae bacterium]|nr:hypothetical protein [Streptosporangiaceae bacterium]
HPITPDDLALLLTEHNLHTQPLHITTTTPNPHTPHTLLTQLTHLLHQPTTTDHTTTWPDA